MMRWIVSAGALAGILLVWAGCGHNSNTTYACDNGVGGVTESLCAQWATQGGCVSHSVNPDGGSSQLTCMGQPTQTFSATCCALTDCKDTTFLKQPISSMFPQPMCDAGAGGG